MKLPDLPAELLSTRPHLFSAAILPVAAGDLARVRELVGAVGTAILGIVLFAEPATAGRLLSLGLIVAGIVGLKLATPG